MFKFILEDSENYDDVLAIREILKDVEYTLDVNFVYTIHSVHSNSIKLKTELSMFIISFI